VISPLRWLLLLAWAASAQAAGDGVQDCITTIAGRHPQETIKATDCPGLLLELKPDSWPLTEPELSDGITPAQLRFLQWARQVENRAVSLNRADLAALLEDVQQPDARDERSPWWKAINHWLDQLKSGDYEADI